MSAADTNEYLDGLDIGHDTTGAVPDQLEDGLQLVPASTINPETPTWLWPGRIPLQAITLLVGEGGLRKTTLACEVTARVTRGQFGRPAASVIFASVEDSTSHTLVPRLTTAGADLDRVYFVRMVAEGFETGLTFPEDLPELESAIVDKDAALLVLDPLVGHLSSNIDSHRDHSVRRALGPLAALAETTGVSVLGISHLNKSGSANTLTRLGGSVGFGNAARSVMLFATNPENDVDSPDRYLAHVKSNLSRLAPTIKYKIEPRKIQVPEGDEISTSGLVMLGETTTTATDLLTPPEPEYDRPERDIAHAVILDALAQSAMPWKDLVRLVRSEGCSDRTARRARDELQKDGLIESSKDGMQGAWSWRRLTPPETTTVMANNETRLTAVDQGTDSAGDDVLDLTAITEALDAELIPESGVGGTE